MNRILRSLAAGVLLVTFGFLPASAADKKDSVKGVVDGSAFRDLAGEDDEVVEVNVGGAMLQALAGDKAGEGELGGVLRGLHSIRAYIVELGDDAARIEKAFRLAANLETKLRGQGWAQVVSIRDKGSRVNVWTLSDDETIQGLVVTAVEADEGKVVFVNIAGAIDLARLGELTELMDLPGLDAVDEATKPTPAEGKSKQSPKEAE